MLALIQGSWVLLSSGKAGDGDGHHRHPSRGWVGSGHHCRCQRAGAGVVVAAVVPGQCWGWEVVVVAGVGVIAGGGGHQWAVMLILVLPWLLLSAAGWCASSTPSGCCSQRESFHPRAASQRRSSAAGPVEYPPCLESSPWRCRSCQKTQPQGWLSFPG